jgi:hypothetical protein
MLKRHMLYWNKPTPRNLITHLDVNQKFDSRSKLRSFESGLMAHACNPSYTGGRDQENCSLRPAQANSLRDPILKTQKRAGGVAQMVECLPSKMKPLGSNSISPK